MAEKMLGQEVSGEDEAACEETQCVRPHHLSVLLLFHSVSQRYKSVPPSFLPRGFISAILSVHLAGPFALFPKLTVLTVLLLATVCTRQYSCLPVRLLAFVAACVCLQLCIS